jgi:hypothetical protein
MDNRHKKCARPLPFLFCSCTFTLNFVFAMITLGSRYGQLEDDDVAAAEPVKGQDREMESVRSQV